MTRPGSFRAAARGDRPTAPAEPAPRRPASSPSFSFGPELRPDGGVRFRLWAPGHEAVSLLLDGRGAARPMARAHGGWHELAVPDAGAGTRYRFELTGGARIPDPASRFQPDDVFGPSEVVDASAFQWSDAGWTGRPWHEVVVYELHVGAFTTRGTFRAALERLPHLADLGVTAVELMPLADFPGRRNWGYDGVLPFAPDSSYGRPDDLRAFVDAAHRLGLMVFLDVVYNHFGPEGNPLSAAAPAFFTDRHRTPWGRAINFDGDDSGPVREFFVENAAYWIGDFHIDGLRLDAVHSIADASPRHVLLDIAERARGRAGARRLVHLTLEDADNRTRFLARDRGGTARWYDAQWNDDAHHGLHVAATGETAGYYADYADYPVKLGRALAQGFAFQGESFGPFDGRPRGEPSAHLPPTAFVPFLQNHDQVGNRAFGERIGALAEPRVVRAVACLYLLSPQIPLLFMGEEWSAPQPFLFFCDFSGDLARAVREGRRSEFARFPEFADPAVRDRIPDPVAASTFAASTLDWSDLGREPHAGWLDWYRRVLRVRRDEIAPRLASAPGHSGTYEVVGQAGLSVRWRLGGGARLAVLANLSGTPIALPAMPMGRVVWAEGDGLAGRELAAWSVIWTVENPAS